MAPVLGQLERGARGGDLGMARLFAGHPVEHLLGLGEILLGDGGAGEAGDRLDIVGIVLQHLGEDLAARGVIAGGDRLLGERHRLGHRDRDAAAGRRARPTNCFTWLSGKAPTKPSTGRPSLKA